MASQRIEQCLLLASKEWLNVCSAAEQVVTLAAARTAFQHTYGKQALITNATYVFVTTYDGDLLNPDLTVRRGKALDHSGR
jgi:hypothetical protein